MHGARLLLDTSHVLLTDAVPELLSTSALSETTGTQRYATQHPSIMGDTAVLPNLQIPLPLPNFFLIDA